MRGRVRLQVGRVPMLCRAMLRRRRRPVLAPVHLLQVMVDGPCQLHTPLPAGSAKLAPEMFVRELHVVFAVVSRRFPRNTHLETYSFSTSLSIFSFVLSRSFLRSMTSFLASMTALQMYQQCQHAFIASAQ